jgi:sulfopyruvate decarboxylase alpha subunit
MSSDAGTKTRWQDQVYDLLRQHKVTQFAYVPDAGHRILIDRSLADADVHSVALTTEEEGVALAAGAWLGGDRTALLMQSSGVGNCVNMLSLMTVCRFPLLTLVTMRGEWAEFNPWQVPMGQATPAVLAQMGVTVLRVRHAEEAAEVVDAAAALAFDGDQQVAVLISQRMIGRKKWVGQE